MATELEGAVQLRRALKRFAPDLSKQTQAEIGAALKTVTAVAKGFVPNDSQLLSGWTNKGSSENLNYRPFPKFNSAEAKRGITYSAAPSKPNKNGFVSLARIFNKSAAGAIYETSGRKNPGGRQVVNKVTVTKSYYSYTYDRTGTKEESNSLNPNAPKQFWNSLESTGKLVNARPLGMQGRPSRKETGRLIFRAWAEDNGRANAAVIKAIEKSATLFYEYTKRAA